MALLDATETYGRTGIRAYVVLSISSGARWRRRAGPPSYNTERDTWLPYDGFSIRTETSASL